MLINWNVRFIWRQTVLPVDTVTSTSQRETR
jgi:hypothetical protein